MQSNQDATSTTTDPDDPIISTSGRVYVSGRFPYVLVLESTTLAEIDRIPLEAKSHCRLSLLDTPNDDETSSWIAVSQGSFGSPSDRVLIYDVKTKECVNELIGASGDGLETISNSSLSSNSIVVSSGERKILVFDSITSDVLCEFPNAPFRTFRISHFPEWNRNKVFVGGALILSQYDLAQENVCVRMGKYQGHTISVNGLSASISHQLLLSGSDDKTLKCWNFNQFDSCINSIQLDNKCYSVKYLEDLHLICCGTVDEIEIFDIRNLSQRMRKVEITGGGCVMDLDRIETDSSSSSSPPLCVSGGNGRVVSIWNPINGAVLHEQRCGSVYGVRFLGDAPPLIIPSTSAVDVKLYSQPSQPTSVAIDDVIDVVNDSNCLVGDDAVEHDLEDGEEEVALSTSPADGPIPVPEPVFLTSAAPSLPPSDSSPRSVQCPPSDDVVASLPESLPMGTAISSPMTSVDTPAPTSLNLLLDPASITISREVLGSGSFGRVMKGTLSILSHQGLQRTIRHPIAIKTIRCSENENEENEMTKEKVLREVRIMAEVNHENCLQCFGCWFSEDPFDGCDRAHVVLELCEKDGIYEWMKEKKANGFFSENGKFRLEILLQITSGMIHLHSKGIVHRDIKPKNLLVDSNGIVKVADYGLSKHVGSVGSTVCGTSIYIDNPLHRGSDPTKRDIYSFALVAYELWYCTLAFEDLRQRYRRDVVALLTVIRDNDLRPVIEPGTMPSELSDLLERGWDNNPELRPSFEEIHSVLISLLSTAPDVVPPVPDPLPPLDPSSNSFSFFDRSETVSQRTPIEETQVAVGRAASRSLESFLEENGFGDLMEKFVELEVDSMELLKFSLGAEETRDELLGELFSGRSLKVKIRKQKFVGLVEGW